MIRLFSRLAWERLGVTPEELEEVAGDRDVWASLLKLLPPRPDPWTPGDGSGFSSIDLVYSSRGIQAV